MENFFFRKNTFWFLFMASPQILGISMSPKVGFPGLPSTKTYQSIKLGILAANRNQVNIIWDEGPCIYLRLWDPDNGNRISGKERSSSVSLGIICLWNAMHTYLCTNIFSIYHQIKITIKRQKQYITMCE